MYELTIENPYRRTVVKVTFNFKHNAIRWLSQFSNQATAVEFEIGQVQVANTTLYQKIEAAAVAAGNKIDGFISGRITNR